MSEVSSAPPVHELYKNGRLDNFSLPEISQDQLKELSYGDIKGIIRGSLKRQYKAAGGNPELQKAIKCIPAVAFGPLMFNDEQLGDLSENEAKEISARLQQTLVHSIYYAGQPRAEAMFSETAYGLIKTIEALYDRPEEEFENLRRWWKGVKVELAVVKALKSNQFSVVLPDYSRSSKEVLDMDVRGGIDMTATHVFKPNTIFAIDATSGRRREGSSKSHAKLLSPDDLQLRNWESWIKDRLLGGTNRNIVRAYAEVYVHDNAFSPLFEMPDRREAVRNYGHLSPTDENGIIRPLLDAK